MIAVLKSLNETPSTAKPKRERKKENENDPAESFLKEVNFIEFSYFLQSVIERVSFDDLTQMRMLIFLYTRKLKRDFFLESKDACENQPRNRKNRETFFRYTFNIGFRYKDPKNKINYDKPELSGIPDRIEWFFHDMITVKNKKTTSKTRILSNENGEYTAKCFKGAKPFELELIMKYENELKILRKSYRN